MEELTLKNFDKKIKASKIPVIVYFNGSWCKPCKRFKQVLDEMKEELKYKIKVCSVDLEQESHLGQRFNILSLPTVLFFNKGKQVTRVDGAPTKIQLKKKIKEFFGIEL